MDKIAEQLHCYRVNYDLTAWAKITNGFADPVAPAGAILAVNALCDMVEGLQAELDSLRKDAERYRWLRDSNVGPFESLQRCMEDLGHGLQTLKCDTELDDAVDDAINTASEALGDGRMAGYFHAPDYYRDNKSQYGGAWVAKYADGTEIPINCDKDKNIFFYASDHVKAHGKCMGLLKIDAAIAGEKK